MDFKIGLAGIEIDVYSLYDEVYELCRDYLTDAKADFTVTISEEDIAFERNKSIREALLEHRSVRMYPDSYLETLAVYRQIAVNMLRFDTILMHGAVVAADGQGYLFTAPSGTGKTTHTRLWLENIPGTFIVNGDKPLICVTENGGTVFGTPWAGKEGIQKNTGVPLKAICLLERGERNEIAPVTLLESYPVLIQQTYRPKEAAALTKTMLLLRTLSEHVPIYRLHCNMEPEAAKVAYEGMNSR